MKPKIDSMESERLLLEIRRGSHATELFELFCEKDLYNYMKRDVPPSIECLANGFKALEAGQSPDGKEIWLGWVGREKSTQKPVGVFEITIVIDEAFIAYTVFKEFWGVGYASEASKSMIEYVLKIQFHCIRTP